MKRIPIAPLFQITAYVQVETANDLIGIARLDMLDCRKFPRSERSFKRAIRGLGETYALKYNVKVIVLTCITEERYNKLRDAFTKRGSKTSKALLDFEKGTVTESDEGAR